MIRHVCLPGVVGYHVCLTRKRSAVRTRWETFWAYSVDMPFVDSLALGSRTVLRAGCVCLAPDPFAACVLVLRLLSITIRDDQRSVGH